MGVWKKTPGGCIMDEVCIAKGSTTNEKDPKVWRTVETNRFPVLGIYPETVFPKEVLNDNPERLRAAFVSLTNPARSYPDSSRMRKALKALDLLVVIEVAMTETAKEADYILPAKNSYETYDFNTFAMTYPEIVCHLRHPILDSVGERKEGAEIWLEIAEAVGVLPKLPKFIYDAAKKAVQTGDRIPFFLKLAVYVFLNRIDMKLMPALIGQTLGREMGSPVRSVMWAGLLTSPLVGTGQVERAGIKPSNRHKILNKIPILKDFCLMDAAFELVDQRPEGAVIGITGKDDMIKRRVKHKDHLIHLYCDEINEYMDRITPEKEEAELTLNKEYPMLVSSGRHTDEGCNTIMRNPAAYAYRKSCTVTMNPADAKNMGFVNDQQVRIITKAGEMTATVEITYTMSPGYCMVPHYFGLEFEGKTVGCGANEIVSENDLDEITGNPYLRYIPCRIEAL